MLAQIIHHGQLEDAQAVCAKNGEPPLSIKDIPQESSALMDARKFFGIKGFSDKPVEMKDFWEKMPEKYKSENNEQAYRTALRSVTTSMLTLGNKKGAAR